MRFGTAARSCRALDSPPRAATLDVGRRRWHVDPLGVCRAERAGPPPLRSPSSPRRPASAPRQAEQFDEDEARGERPDDRPDRVRRVEPAERLAQVARSSSGAGSASAASRPSGSWPARARGRASPRRTTARSCGRPSRATGRCRGTAPCDEPERERRRDHDDHEQRARGSRTVRSGRADTVGDTPADARCRWPCRRRTRPGSPTRPGWCCRRRAPAGATRRSRRSAPPRRTGRRWQGLASGTSQVVRVSGRPCAATRQRSGPSKRWRGASPRRSQERDDRQDEEGQVAE